MTKPDMRWPLPFDLVAAVGLLTRAPVAVDPAKAAARGAAAAWAYPVVGALVGGLQALGLLVCAALGLPVTITAALVLGLGVIVTGAMHEDGLADSADGLWGGWDRTRRLAIMKDSHIGSYGVIALILSLLLRWLALVAVLTAGNGAVALIVVGACSRAAMVAVMAGLPHARPDGLAHAVGRPSARTALVAVALAALAALVAGWPLLLPVAGLAALACALIARAKIGGQTGDILGAVQQVAEIALLVTLAAAAG